MGLSRNIIIIGCEKAQNWWPSQIIIATLNWWICPPNQSNRAQISKLLTRKTRFFIYHFIFVPNAKQSAWVYSAIKSNTLSSKNKGIADISMHAFVYILIPVIAPRVKTQDSKLQISFFLAEFKTSDFSSQCKRKIILQNYILHPMNLVNVKKSF